MGPGLTADDRQFLDDARAFIAAHWRPAHQRGGHSPAGQGTSAKAERYAWARPDAVPAARAWFDALAARGWSVPHWPVAHGGTGWPAAWQYLWARELALAEAPQLDSIGVNWVGPALCAWGDAEQQARWLPGIREARDRWCLGFALPEAGADLASVDIRARRGAGARAASRDEREVYRVDGLQSWVSGAAQARWMLALVRTGPAAAAPDEALSLLLIDLAVAGVTVEPVRMLDGSAGVGRVRLEQVQVPVSQRLCAEGVGSAAVRELTAAAGRHVEPAAALRVLADKLEGVAAELPGDAGRLADDPGFARKLAEVGVDLAGLEALEFRQLAVQQQRLQAKQRQQGQQTQQGQQWQQGQQRQQGQEQQGWERSPDRDVSRALLDPQLSAGPPSDLPIATGGSLLQEEHLQTPVGDRGDLPIAIGGSLLQEVDLQISAGGSSDLPIARSLPPEDVLPLALRLRHARLAQRIGELLVEAFGYYSVPYPDSRTIDNEGPIGHDYALAAVQGMLAGRSLSIDGGAGETLRDRLAKQLFGY